MTDRFARPITLGMMMLGAAGSVVPARAQPQPAAPNLSRPQRAALQAVVQAMDRGTSANEVSDHDWPLHVLRASDGSHYVAFTVASSQGLTVNRPVVLYVRLATRSDQRVAAVTERSAVAEWLAGQAPAPVLSRRGIAFGEMPTYGAGGIAVRGPGPQSLQLLDMEMERAREKREAAERERKATLEGAGSPRGPRPMLPFEDFDLRAIATADALATPLLRRSLTAGPGDYDLLVGWADPDAKDVASTVRILKRRLTLAAASTTEFGLSSVIVADEVAVRELPLSAAEQSAHPYSIGTMDITPARDERLTSDERLALVVQVINARGSPTGRPDVVVGFRVFRSTNGSEEAVGSLAPQSYNDASLPADFDVAKRHPLFAAVGIPLRTFKRGQYRLEIAANDRIAGTGTTTDATFTIVGTPAALLRDAPPLAAPYRRDDLLQGPLIDELLTRLRPPRPSSALAAALDAARARRFVELIREDVVASDEIGARNTLRALALYALGDGPTALAAPLRQVLQQSASPAAAQILIGAVRALEGNDREAITTWEAAIAGGADARTLAPLLADALLRQGEASRAAEVAQRASGTTDGAIARRLAAAQIAGGRFADALRTLDAHLAQHPDNSEARWLTLHALFAGLVAGTGPGADAEGRARLAELTARYIAANGRHAALAKEWAVVVAAK